MYVDISERQSFMLNIALKHARFCFPSACLLEELYCPISDPRFHLSDITFLVLRENPRGFTQS